MVVLDSEHIGYVLDNEPPAPLVDEATAEERQTHKKWEDDELKVRRYIKSSLSSQLLEQYEKLQELYDESISTVSYEVTSKLFRMRMVEGTSLSDHVLKMIKLIKQVEGFDLYLEYRIQVNLILQPLPPSFKSYITNFNMNKLVTSIETL
ncbi:hypothetical protein Pint_25474 [Pistacia integerrima]|uniref:Uncharacterized protein n=1 Tax=Pistacia integerrima TaxID=434235 RepID=A0ACC0YDG5_9ROSI|nr:hypothetical protein Pint_25474 [Pistacia integerrima]